MKNKTFVFDVDGTLTKPRQKILLSTKQLLINLSQLYDVYILGAGCKKRIQKQLDLKTNNILIYDNYGNDKNFIKEDINIIKEKTNIIRNLFQLKIYKGQSLDINKTRITFALLGTKALLKDKLKFDPNQSIRNKILPTFKEFLPNYEIIIGGTSSFDILPLNINKAYGIKRICKEHNLKQQNIIYIGDDFNPHGNDWHVFNKTKTTCYFLTYKNINKYIERWIRNV